MVKNFINDCTDSCIVKTEKYFLEKGFIISSMAEIEGLDNKTFGDLRLTLYKDGVYKNVYIDYKKQVRDREYIPIELIQVGAQGKYDSWLYNPNIHYCIYEFKDGSTYLFEHSELIKIAKQNNNEDMWETCLVYSKSPSIYIDERKWIDGKLDSFKVRSIQGSSIVKADHINGAFNYKYDGTRVHSGFCLNLGLDQVERYKL